MRKSLSQNTKDRPHGALSSEALNGTVIDKSIQVMLMILCVQAVTPPIKLAIVPVSLMKLITYPLKDED